MRLDRERTKSILSNAAWASRIGWNSQGLTDHRKLSPCQVGESGNFAAPLGKKRVKLDGVAIEMRYLIELTQGETKIAQNVDYVTNQLLPAINRYDMGFQFDSQTAFQKMAKTKQNFILEALDIYFYDIRRRNRVRTEQFVIPDALDLLRTDDFKDATHGVVPQYFKIW